MRGLTFRLMVLTVGLALIAAPAAASTAEAFQGPLFGITGMQREGLLVADASSGIHLVNRHGRQLVVELPDVTDVSHIGWQSMWATTSGGEEGVPATLGVYRIIRGEPTLAADLAAFEAARNPDGGEIDSNPFDVQSLGWNAALVADAAGNDLLKVKKDGRVKVLAVFPDELVSTEYLKSAVGCPDPAVPDFTEFCGLPEMVPAQAVPTSIAVGPDGYYYVGELKGFPGPLGESGIWRVSPHARWASCPSADCVEVFDGGFTSIIDLAFGPDGKLYVAELDEAGWVAVEITGDMVGGTINKCDIHTLKCREVATEIPMLTAIAFAKRGALWATQNALVPGAAEVIRIR